MLTATADDLAATAERLAAALRLAGVPATVVPGESAVGGGAFPTASLPTSLVRIDMPDRTAAAVETALRAADPPVIARIVDDRVVLDPRTLPPDALARLPAIVGQVLASSARHD
jgi:L-seryl-tRNA(Ser) seleniumtransferase